MGPLDLLLEDGVIDEVLGRLKSGKEADISLVRRQGQVVAAKVYKDRATRSFKNNADYKEGRKVRNSRTQRAMDSGGSFGRDAAEQAWKSAEADTLYKLVGTGVRIPHPVMFYESVLLMELVTDADGRPAPRLIDVAIDPQGALGVFADLLSQMISMLCCDLIHGDLSPYNILAAANGPTIIDFPQVVSAVHSSRAEYFFLRDFDNVLRFLVGFDPKLDAHRDDGRAIWRAYVSRELTPEFVPPPPRPRQDRPPQRSGPPRDQRSQQRGNQRPGQRWNQSQQQRSGPPQQRSGPPQQRSGPPQQRSGPQPQRSGPPQQRSGPQPQRSGAPQPQRSGAPQPQRSGAPQPQRSGPQPQRSGPPQPPRWDPPPAQRQDPWPGRRPNAAAAPNPSGGKRRRPKRHW